MTFFRFFLTILLVGISLGAGHAQVGRGVLTGDHGDASLLPKSCRSCHRGMAIKISGEEVVCLNCHGTSSQQEAAVGQGLLEETAGQLADISAELRKPFNHPVLTVQGVHQQLETLPEESVRAPRHSECVDCHDPHAVTRENPFRGIRGKRVGNFMADVGTEYELCYKCHAESANLPAISTNKHMEFRATNPSFHPVEGEGANQYVISLKEPYVARKTRPGDISTISCKDCHGSDDPSAPGGPHGSNFRGLLVKHYEMEDGRPESEYTYALCYSCHERSSILGNESFPYHSLHIQGNRGAGQPGTSCFTCHDAHGSSRYQYLIRFNEDVVQQNLDGKIEFSAQGVASRHGTCLLNCHGVEHNPSSY